MSARYSTRRFACPLSCAFKDKRYMMLQLVWLSDGLQHLMSALCMHLFIMCVWSDPALCNEHCHGMVYGCMIHPMALPFHNQGSLTIWICATYNPNLLTNLCQHAWPYSKSNPQSPNSRYLGTTFPQTWVESCRWARDRESGQRRVDREAWERTQMQ